MRIYSNAYELMSEMGRNLWEMGSIVHPHSMQNLDVKNDEDFKTKELIAEQYCLVNLPDEERLFIFSNSKDWADAEHEERILPSRYFINPGEAYKLREDLWKTFLNEEGSFDYTYNERISYPIFPTGFRSNDAIPTIDWIICELRKNPDTRQAIIPIFHNTDLDNIGGIRRVPCSMYYQLFIRTNPAGNKVLHLIYSQRSCDFVTHFGNDVYLAWKMKDYLAGELNIQPGYLYHNINSMHSYKKDWDQLKNICNK